MLSVALCELQNSGNNSVFLCIFDKIVNILSYIETLFIYYFSDLSKRFNDKYFSFESFRLCERNYIVFP